MISVVCVFNDLSVLEARLLQSLAVQTGEYELIKVDNRDSRFSSAAAALNWGAAQAKGDWLLFAHQDVALLSTDWLARAEKLLNEYAITGWAGVAGRHQAGEFRGFLVDREHLFGTPFTAPVEIQTLDECVLMHRREANAFRYFDEGLVGWHAYGAEACCAAEREGRKNFVLSLPTWHDSKSSNMEGLAEAHEYVWKKHGPALRRIATLMAILPDDYGWGTSRRFRMRAARKIISLWGKQAGFQVLQVGHLGEALERLTSHAPVVETLHKQSPQEVMEVGAFVPQPAVKRRVLHYFAGLNFAGLKSRYFLIAPDLAAELRSVEETLNEAPRDVQALYFCAPLWDLLKKPKLWRALRRRSPAATLVLHWNMTVSPFIIFNLVPSALPGANNS